MSVKAGRHRQEALNQIVAGRVSKKKDKVVLNFKLIERESA